MVGLITVFVGAIGAICLSAAQNAFNPLYRYINQTLSNCFPNEICDPNTLTSAFIRQMISRESFNEHIQKLGFDEEQRQILINANKQILPVLEYVTAYWRGIIDESELDFNLTKSGFNTYDLMLLKQTSRYIPNIQDMIRFAVREVYSPEKRQFLQLDSEFPSEFTEHAKMQGMDETTAKDYWAAHWELPSLNHAFEMLHRKQIEMKDIDMLLKIQDVLPKFREPLKAIAYQPLTRVDVRRMYRVGKLDEKGVKHAYDVLGYNEENAQLMTDFTVAYESEDDKMYTTSLVMSAAIDKLISIQELTEYLTELGYSEKSVHLYVSRAEYEIEMYELKRQVDMIKSDVRMHKISKEEANLRLLQLGQPAAYTEQILKEIEAEEESKWTEPTKADLTKWFKQRIITVEYFISKMKLRGYTKETIDNYILSIAIDEGWIEEEGEEIELEG